MNVALVTQPYDEFLPPKQNSIGLILFNTAVELARDATVRVYMKRAPQGAQMTGHAFEIDQIDTPLDDRLMRFVSRHPRWGRRLGLSAVADRYGQYVSRVGAGLAASRPDIVHLMNYWSWCEAVSDRARRHKVVLEMQSEWLSQMNVRDVGRQLQFADAIVTVSDHIARLFKQTFPEYPGVVGTAYNGVDTAVFQPAPRQPNGERSILFVGRTSPEKGVHVLIRAFAQVAAMRDDVRLDIAGPRTTLPARYLVGISDDPVVRRLAAFYDGTVTSDYQAHLDELVRTLGLDQKVRFHGSLPHSRLVELYQRATVVCNPSFSESFGISIVEGMACEVPVVGARVGGMQETVLDGETGFLVEPDEPDALAAAIGRLLDDEELGRRMGAAGRRRAIEQFTWAARAKRLIAIYGRAMLARGTS